ncbi:hypothetical protein [Lactococcus fujiensis]|uniref:hypothetical protein n=1 Tax=Lactococcus fujiensis TaxID=610251 RepID=UPI002093EC77|nr:hypothetical protein [Lactococcus fujiensis]
MKPSVSSSKSTSESSTSSSSSSVAPAEKLEVTSISGSTMNITLSNAVDPIKIVFTGDANSNVWVLARNTDMSTAGVTISNQNPSATASLTSGATQSTITLGKRTNLAITINGQAVDLSKYTTTIGPYNIYLTVTPATGTTSNATTATSTATTTNSSAQ